MMATSKLNMAQAAMMGLPLFIELWDENGLPVYRISVHDCETEVKFGTATIRVPDLNADVAFQLAAMVITAMKDGKYFMVERVNWKGPSIVHPYETLHIHGIDIATS